MIDPTNITNYNLTPAELEEHILFWVCAAGKNGVTAAKCLDKLLFNLRTAVFFNDDFKDRQVSWLKNLSPFDLILLVDETKLAKCMMNAGIGCHTLKSKTFLELAHSSINLNTCTVDELEAIKGIGPKTARCFLIHSRPNQKLAGLDRHILNFLRDKGYNVPKSTPIGTKYKQIEQWFVQEADKAGKDIAAFDLEIWNKYRSKQ